MYINTTSMYINKIVFTRYEAHSLMVGKVARKTSIGIFLWHLQAQFLHHHLQIFPGLFLLTRVAQQDCRMVGDCELGAAEIVPMASQFGHGGVDGEKRL